MDIIPEEVVHPLGGITPVSKPFDQEKSKKKLTRKQAIFVKELLDNPKISATEAARRAYNTTTNHSAEVIASENLSKPEIISHLSDHVSLVESTLENTVREWGKSENSRRRELALDSAKFIHDKIFGRAAQKVDITEKKLSISIDLTGKG